MHHTDSPLRKRFNRVSSRVSGWSPGACAPSRRRTLLALPSLLALLVVLAITAGSALAREVHVFNSSFAEPGTGNGQLELREHSGVAIDPTTGDVYVADTGNGRIEEFQSNGTFIRTFGSFADPTFVAIDNSAAGSVYVVDSATATVSKFDSAGVLVASWGSAGHLTGNGVEAFGEIAGIAVDGSGRLDVLNTSSKLFQFDGAGTSLTSFETLRGTEPVGLAVAPGGSFFKVNGDLSVQRFGPTRESSVQITSGVSATGIAVDPATGILYVDAGTEILGYSFNGAGEVESAAGNCNPEPSTGCEPTERFGSSEPEGGSLSQAQGLAIDSSHFVYAANRGPSTIAVFSTVQLPDVLTGEATGLAAEGDATLNGTVNPHGESITACEFQYGPTIFYGSTAPCAVPPGSGTNPEAVSAELTGLPAGRYHFRLLAASANGTETGGDRSFLATAHPVISGAAATNVLSSSASIDAQVSPGGLPTTYSIEYGSTVAYGSATAPTSLGNGASFAGVIAPLSGLQPNATYHARLRATNERGTSLSPDITFTTASPTAPINSIDCPNGAAFGFSAFLPDCRAYELVSAAGGPGEVYVPAGGFFSRLGQRNEDILTERPMRASADGAAVSYVGEPGSVGGIGAVGRNLGNQFLASRDAAGWAVNNVTPQATSPEETEEPVYESFSDDLAVGVLSARTKALATEASPPGPAPPCYGLYSRTGGPASNAYHGLFSEPTLPGSCGFTRDASSSFPQDLVFAGGNGGTPTVPRFGLLLLQSPAALTPGAEPKPEGADAGSNLYLSAAGHLTAVNLLPDGTRPAAVFGGPPPAAELEKQRPDFSDAISADGSQVFWTDVETGRIYDRIAGIGSVPVSSGSAQYYTASPDGRFVLYLENEELWRYDTQAAPGLQRQSIGSPGVAGVVGAAADTSYVYFVSGAVQAAGTEARTCREAIEEEEELRGRGELTEELREGFEREQRSEEHGHLTPGRGCNLYLAHDGAVQFTGIVLAARDDKFFRSIPSSNVQNGDWQAELGSHTAAATASGHQLVFESTQQLTGYDNSSLTFPPSQPRRSAESAAEVFVYDAEAGDLTCASCDPHGLPPTPEVNPELSVGTYLPVSLSSTYMRRWISADGSRVFFDTSQPLLTQDTNGAQDVYEWERQGTAGCPASTSVEGGCVFLLSGGTSRDLSFFVDASASGDDVFFTHRGPLGGVGSPSGPVSLFDARVDGGLPAAASTCTGPECPVPASPSVSGPPASAAFVGHGNVHARRSRHQLAAALRRCRTQRPKGRRTACEKRAKKRYGGPAAKRKARTKASSGRKSK